MIGPQWALLTPVALAVLSVGCASVQKDAGFADVQAAIRQRSGFEAYWEQQTTGESAVKERIRALLQEELTDRDAVEIALLNNGRLQATFEELGIARADLMEAGLIRNPLLNFEIRYPDRPFELALTQTIMDLITLPRRRSVAAAAFEAAKLHVADQVMTMIVEVRSAFYTLQAAEQALAMRRTIVDAERISADLAIRQYEAGNISDLELENEQAMLEQAKLDLARGEAEVLAERERLNRLLGLWGGETTWRISSGMPDLPPAEAELEGMESRAVSQRLDLAAMRQEVEGAARAVGLARPESIGEILAGVHREREPEGTLTTGPVVEIPLPLFNRGKARRLRAEAVLRQALQRYAALAVEIRSEVRESWQRMRLARSRAEYYQNVILPRRARVIAYSQRHYNFMLLGAFDLFHARQDEIAARHESIEALRDYWVARTELERAVGWSLPPGEPAPQGDQPGGDTKEETVPGPAHPGHQGGR